MRMISVYHVRGHGHHRVIIIVGVGVVTIIRDGRSNIQAGTMLMFVQSRRRRRVTQARDVGGGGS